MRKLSWRSVRLWALLGLVLVPLACESSDNIPPDGSTITLAATPAQIILAGGVQASPVTILATVRNGIGVPLPDQDVRFTTSSGVLDPIAGTPVSTDADGNAFTTLTAATVGPTITADSGLANASLTLTAASGALASITLDPSPLNLTTCSDTFDLIATARDPAGATVDGVTLFFEFVTSGMDEATGTFVPGSGVSGAVNPGEVEATLTIDNPTCSTRCIGAGMDCTTRIRARDQGGTILSNEVTIRDQVN